MEILSKGDNNFFKSIIKNASEILSALNVSQTKFMKPIDSLITVQDIINFNQFQGLNILSDINDFIENMPNIKFQQFPISEISLNVMSVKEITDFLPDVDINDNNGIKNNFLYSSKQHILSESLHNIVRASCHSDTQIALTSPVISTTDHFNSLNNNIQNLIPLFTLSIPKSTSWKSSTKIFSSKKWHSQLESVLNLQCQGQELNGLKCLGLFTFPVLKQALKNIEVGSDARLIISKVLDMQKVSEYINDLAISNIYQANQKNEQIITHSPSLSNSDTFLNQNSSIFQSKQDNNSISESLSSIGCWETLKDKEKYSGFFSSISIDRLIGSVNINHSGNSLNDESVKFELEQAVLLALSKVLEKNLEDST